VKSYEEIKKIAVDHKTQIIQAVCFVLVFIVGFGTGKFEKEINKSNNSQSHYTTPTATKATKPAGDTAKEKTTTTPAKAAVAGANTENCLIKGNINAKGGKIYHMPGGASYKITKPEQCFQTEAEATAAGFVKSSR
jgi:competence protein ComEC